MNMPENVFKRRLKAGEQQIGLWVTIPDPGVVEALAGSGFDWILIDTEHTPVETSMVQSLLQAAAPYPSAAVVRPYENNTALIKRHLDQGAQTLLLPHIQTKAEAEAAVTAIRYAQDGGVRGVAGIHRASRYGRVKDYTATAAKELCLILQIETVGAMAQLEDIATVPGVDAIFIGPADFATSMGYPGQANHPKVKAAILDGFARLKAMGVPSGILTLNPEFARECIAAGTTFTAVGVDLALLVNSADALAADFMPR
jgi:4-hydroxy-2-oxoheptanedioate aldolase